MKALISLILLFSINSYAGDLQDFEKAFVTKYKCSRYLSYIELSEFNKEFKTAINGISNSEKSIKKLSDKLELIDKVKFADSVYTLRRLAAYHLEVFEEEHPIAEYINVSKRELAAIEEVLESAYKEARLNRRAHRKALDALVEDCNYLIDRGRP